MNATETFSNERSVRRQEARKNEKMFLNFNSFKLYFQKYRYSWTFYTNIEFFIEVWPSEQERRDMRGIFSLAFIGKYWQQRQMLFLNCWFWYSILPVLIKFSKFFLKILHSEYFCFCYCLIKLKSSKSDLTVYCIGCSSIFYCTKNVFLTRTSNSTPDQLKISIKSAILSSRKCNNFLTGSPSDKISTWNCQFPT